jgi:iron(III) transport system ATP-binding protein
MVEVRLKDVTKSFGKVKAVNNISLEVEKEELFFLLGPSGCGKTTTLRIIAGFYVPEEGKIFFDDKIMNNVPPNKRNIGMVFQNYALWPHMTVYDNITYGLKVKGISQNSRVQKAKKVLRIVKMERFSKRYPNQLSGGQQQRIALARALVIEPDLLLFDEPLSNLDAKLRIDTREEIKRIQKELGITTIYVTHDQSEALSMADKIAIMKEGQIEQIGSPREIYNNPTNGFVASFIGETNFLQGKIKELRKEKAIAVVEVNLEYDIYASIPRKKFSKGNDVICSVRPERIRVVKENIETEKDHNIFKGTISSLDYYGFLEHYVINALGTELKVTNFNPRSSTHREGDKVYLSFNFKDIDIF